MIRLAKPIRTAFLFVCLLAFSADVFAQPAQPTKPPPSQNKNDDADEGVSETVAKDGSTEINVKNADIAAVIRIFSKRTKRNYILDERVKGKVSIYLPGKVSASESLRILDSVLALKGFSTVPIGENLWKIVPSREARQSTIPTITEPTDEQLTSTVVTRIVTPKYVSVEDLQQILQQLISPDGLITAYTGTNSLILVDLEDNIGRLVGIINSLDVPYTDREMTIIPIQYADVKEIADKLNEILGTPKASSSGASNPESESDLLRARIRESAAQNGGFPPGQPPPAGGANANAPAATAFMGTSKTISPRSRAPSIIADERTNSIIVVADDDTTARVRALISQLDSKVDLSGNRFYVYRCQHANAADLSEVLSSLVGGGGGTSSGTASASATGTSRSRSSGTFGSSFSSNSSDEDGSMSRSNNLSRSRAESLSRTQSRNSSQQRNPGQPRPTGGSTGAAASVQFGENVSITADPATNSLIISAGKADYEKIKSLLEQLDVKRRQVIVEAMLLEVGVDEGVDMGTSWLSSAGGADGGVLAKSDFGGDLAKLLADPSQVSRFSVAAASSGTLTLPGDIKIPTQALLVTAAQSNTNVNVLSAPTVLTTDNEEASIVVGQNVPFLASVSTNESNLNNTFNQIDRQDVGITLRLTPQISSENYVKLHMFTEVSDVIRATLASSLGPTTSIRTSETSVIAKDGQMIVTGGLMSDATSENEEGVPYLQDIPLLGHVFGDRSSSRSRKNLLIFITPRIVRDQYDARDVTYEHKDNLEGDIRAFDTYPSRDEVLHSPNLDHVTEREHFKGAKPGTILPPTKLEQPQEIESSHSLNTDSEGVIEMRVAPKLPPAEADSPNKPSEFSALEDGKRVALAPSNSGMFIVFEAKGDTSKAENLPFSFAQGGSRFGVEVPAESGLNVREFFKIGSRYRYQTGSQSIEVQPVARFASSSEAESLYSGRWYTLSPYEIMNLGKAPWSAVN